MCRHPRTIRRLLFLYRQMMGAACPGSMASAAPAQKRRITSVLREGDVAALFQCLDGEMAWLAKLPCDIVMRLRICAPQKKRREEGEKKMRQAVTAGGSPLLAVLPGADDLLSLLAATPGVTSPESCPPSSITILP